MAATTYIAVRLFPSTNPWFSTESSASERLWTNRARELHRQDVGRSDLGSG